MTLFSWLFPQPTPSRRKRAKQAPVSVRWTPQAQRGLPERIGDRFSIPAIIVIHGRNREAGQITEYLAKFGAKPTLITKRKNYMMLQIKRTRYKWTWYLLATAGYEPSQEIPRR